MADEHISVDCSKAASDIKHASSGPSSPGFVSYDHRFSMLLGDTPAVKLVEQRSNKFAHEAGVYIKSTNKEYFTSNYQSDKSIEVYSVDCASHKSERLHLPEVVNPNGACNYQDKVLFCCQGSLDTPSALVLFDPKTSATETLLNNFYGREFNSVNDVVVHHETGDIWFTDPKYGYHQAFRPSPLLPSQVYRFRPSTGQIWCVADGFVECNGLCFSQDYRKMYITDTGAVQAHDGPKDGLSFSFNPALPATVYSYDVVDGTKLANRQTFAFCNSGVPDGIKCDEAGNVYSGCGDGIHAWDPEGTLLGKIYTGSVVANFNFAKDGIWAFAEERLFHVKFGAKGALVRVECE